MLGIVYAFVADTLIVNSILWSIKSSFKVSAIVASSLSWYLTFHFVRSIVNVGAVNSTVPSSTVTFAGNSILLVIPRMVRLPTTTDEASSVASSRTSTISKTAVGKLSTKKKSCDLRWPSNNHVFLHLQRLRLQWNSYLW